MNCKLFILILLFWHPANSQKTEVPTGVKLTPAFQAPAITVNQFNQRFPGISPAWRQEGDAIAAEYTDPATNLTRVIFFDRTGTMLGIREQQQKNSYPKQIDHFLSNFYEDQKYEVWRIADSVKTLDYFARISSDTIWFSQSGSLDSKRHTALVGESDHSLVKEIAAEQIMDVTLARLAVVNSSRNEIRQSAEKRAQNDTQLYDSLKRLARDKRLLLPSELSQEQQKKYNELSQLQGEEFDKAYTKYLLKTDKKNNTLLRNAVKTSEDKDVKQWLEKAVETWRLNTAITRDAYCTIK